MKNLNKSIILVTLLALPIFAFAQVIQPSGSIESGGATKIEAGGETWVFPEGSPMEIPIRYTDDIKKYKESNIDNNVSFSLKVGEKRLVSRYIGGITVTLNSLTGITANVTVTIAGGCGPVADDRCLGHPGFEDTFNLKLGEPQRIPGAGASLIFVQRISGTEALFILSTSFTSTRVTPTPTPSVSPSTTPKPTTIKNFKDCVRAGYPVGQSYPATCSTPDGRQFVEEIVEERIFPIVPQIDLITEVKEVDGSYKIKGKKKGKILFLLPVEIDVSYSIKGSAVTNVKRPWWSILVW